MFPIEICLKNRSAPVTVSMVTCRKLFILFKQYSMCIKSIFGHQECNKLHNKSVFINIIVLKAHGTKPRI